jgi:hypothetical protein
VRFERTADDNIGTATVHDREAATGEFVAFHGELESWELITGYVYGFDPGTVGSISPAGKRAAFQSIAMRIRARPLG